MAAERTTAPDDYCGIPDLYTPLKDVVQVLQVSLRHLLSRPKDPLPKALLTHTQFSEAGARRALAVHDRQSMAGFIYEHTVDYYHLLLVGRLLLDSRLGPRLLPSAAGSKEPGPVAPLLPYLRGRTDILLEGSENFLFGGKDAGEEGAAAREWLGEYRAQVTGLFEELGHTLGSKLPLGPPLTAPVQWGAYPLTAQELVGLQATLFTFMSLPILSDQPFAEGVVRLPGYHPQRLEKLKAKLDAVVPDPKPEGRVKVQFTEWQILALYQAARVTGYVMVSGEGYNEGGLDDFLALNPDGSIEDVELSRRIQCAIAEGFAKLVQHSMGGEEEFEAVRERVDALLKAG